MDENRRGGGRITTVILVTFNLETRGVAYVGSSEEWERMFVTRYFRTMSK